MKPSDCNGLKPELTDGAMVAVEPLIAHASGEVVAVCKFHRPRILFYLYAKRMRNARIRVEMPGFANPVRSLSPGKATKKSRVGLFKQQSNLSLFISPNIAD